MAQNMQVLHYLLSDDKIHHMDIGTWLDHLIGDDSRRNAAKKIGLDNSTISRQLSRHHTLSPEVVIALCRAYDYPPVDGLVETGHLKDHEVKGVGVKAALKYATNKDLHDEMIDRVDPDATGNFDIEAVEYFQGTEGEITPNFSNVSSLHSSHVAPLSDDEIADAIREANEMPQAAHTDDGIEYTEPESP